VRTRAFLAFALFCGATPALADALAPFLPAPAAGPQIVRVLAPVDAIDREVIDGFERDSGLVVALDAYGHGVEPAAAGYDLVILRGPALARAIAAGALARLDRKRLTNARLVQPQVQAKLAAYDRDGGFGLAFGWAAFGLLYDADKTAAPASWAEALGGGGKGRNCGAVWPDARDESFLASWKLLGVDPARVRAADVKAAAAALDRARGGFLAFAAPDEVGALAKGTACLGAGGEGEAAAARARGGDNAPDIRFAIPREGAPLALYAYALPRTAPAPDRAYRLIEALTAPDAAARDAQSAGLANAEAPAGLDALKRLTPEPVFEAGVMAAMQAEWKRLLAGK
jgi:putrescine transport system substrate-binding protein